MCCLFHYLPESDWKNSLSKRARWRNTIDRSQLIIIPAQIDSTADFICRGKWGKIEYPPPFGRDAFPEEAYIADIDAKTGASLKVGFRIV